MHQTSGRLDVRSCGGGAARRRPSDPFLAFLPRACLSALRLYVIYCCCCPSSAFPPVLREAAELATDFLLPTAGTATCTCTPDIMLASNAEQKADLVHVVQPIRREPELLDPFGQLCVVI
jgi:hypothetical protein